MDKLIQKIKSSLKAKHVIMSHYQDYLASLPLFEAEGSFFRVRFATVEDIPTMVEMERLAYAGYLAWTLRDFQQDWQRNPYGVFVLLEQVSSGKVVGMVTGRFLAKGAHISHLLVIPEFEGLGLGQKLLRLWIDIVERQGIPKITLEVRKSNQVAQHIYRKHKFIKEKELPYYYFDNDETAYFLCRYN